MKMFDVKSWSHSYGTRHTIIKIPIKNQTKIHFFAYSPTHLTSSFIHIQSPSLCQSKTINQLLKHSQTYSTMSNNHTQLKDGTVVTFSLLQNTTTYQLRVASTAKGLWVCIEEGGVTWKLTISQEMVEQTVSKASAGGEKMGLKEFSGFLLLALGKTSEKWSVGVMTPIQLEVLRGGQPSKQASNNKIYLILSDKEKKLHYPFTFPMSEIGEREKLIQAIKTMKAQLEELRADRADKSQSSFSILNQTTGAAEQLRLQNEEMKRRIHMCEESLTQKRGAVQIDLILKQKNALEMQAENKRRQQAREIARYKAAYQLVDRQIQEVRTEVELITREISLLEDSVGNSNKLKSHALKVLKSYENELRTQKKVLQKQTKEVQNLKRNILASKNNQRKVQAKIKQIQTEIDQSKKKANIKEISNRLHSFKGKASSNDSPSSKSQSVASSAGKPHSQASSNSASRPNNIVRDNLLRKNAPTSSSLRNNLLRTSPNINMVTDPLKKSADKQQRPVNSSHQTGPKTNNYTNPRLFNTQKYRSGSKSDNENNSIRSESAEKKEPTKEDRERQKKAMERLTGPTRTNPTTVPPRAPSQDRLFKKTETNPRSSSNQKPGSVTIKAGSSGKPVGGVKKDSAKEMLQKMKQIKAQYNNRANPVTNPTSSNKPTTTNKISQISDKKNS